jgi:hypothetical protein
MDLPGGTSPCSHHDPRWPAVRLNGKFIPPRFSADNSLAAAATRRTARA